MGTNAIGKTQKPQAVEKRSLLQRVVDLTDTEVVLSGGVDAGVSGVAAASVSVNGHWTPGAKRADVYGTVGAGTAFGGGQYYLGKDKWEGRVTALPLGSVKLLGGPGWLPNLAFSRGDPVVGERLVAYVPMVGSLQITSRGGVGAYAAAPLPWVRPGAGVWVSNPALKSVTQPVFTAIDGAIERAERAGRRAAANLL